MAKKNKQELAVHCLGQQLRYIRRTRSALRRIGRQQFRMFQELDHVETLMKRARRLIKAVKPHDPTSHQLEESAKALQTLGKMRRLIQL